MNAVLTCSTPEYDLKQIRFRRAINRYRRMGADTFDIVGADHNVTVQTELEIAVDEGWLHVDDDDTRTVVPLGCKIKPTIPGYRDLSRVWHYYPQMVEYVAFRWRPIAAKMARSYMARGIHVYLRCEAEDLVEMIMVSAIQAMAQHDPDKSLLGWYMKKAIACDIKDELRKANAKCRRNQWGWDVEFDDDAEIESPAWMSASDTAIVLQDALAGLSERDQSIIHMVAEGYTAAEIGKEFGVTEEAAEKATQRARTRAQIALKGKL
ncbi:MAG TPA: sigma-70 family RNA polymerase sigma factor [Armatimonadota bacterium]|jgi:RNA polymerase sigma factor (sigma-70 family)